MGVRGVGRLLMGPRALDAQAGGRGGSANSCPSRKAVDARLERDVGRRAVRRIDGRGTSLIGPFIGHSPPSYIASEKQTSGRRMAGINVSAVVARVIKEG